MSLLNLNELPKVGEAVNYQHRGGTFQMVVKEARIRYGKIDVFISPVAGDGGFWVRYDGLKAETPVTADELIASANA